MMSLSNHVLVWCPKKEDETVQWDGFKNARKLDVGVMISCPDDEFKFTRHEMGHNPHALGPAKKQAHSC